MNIDGFSGSYQLCFCSAGFFSQVYRVFIRHHTTFRDVKKSLDFAWRVIKAVIWAAQLQFWLMEIFSSTAYCSVWNGLLYLLTFDFRSLSSSPSILFENSPYQIADQHSCQCCPSVDCQRTRLNACIMIIINRSSLDCGWPISSVDVNCRRCNVCLRYALRC